MNRKDVQNCVRVGVHVLGFVVDYPMPVPWNLTASAARELIRQVPPFVSTCAVTGGSVEKVLNIANSTCPDVIQLHYHETLQEIKEIARELNSRGIKTIKALRINNDGTCDFEIKDPNAAARELAQTGAAAILVDSHTPSRPGGTGLRIDLSIFKKIQQASTLPVILAGGLTPANIGSIIQETNPYAVDVLTGIEEKPGHKDPEKIRKFMQNLR